MGYLMTLLAVAFAITAFLFPFKDGQYVVVFWNFLGTCIRWIWQILWFVVQWSAKIIWFLLTGFFKLLTPLFHVRRNQQRPF